MALNVSFTKMYNALRDENMIIPRVVNKQEMEFDNFCEYLADGSTITPGDVAAVMKLIETRLPLILSMNAMVVASPEGLTFRPKVSGSITQSQLRSKLMLKQASDPDADIDVNRSVEPSDLTINDVTIGIAIDLPKKWLTRLRTVATLKRINKDNGSETTVNNDDGDEGGEGNTDQP